MSISLPCPGGCACGEVRYQLVADPVTCYVCHCTDCQTRTGSAFGISMICESDAIKLERGSPELVEVELPDGRVKRANRCPSCQVSVWGSPRASPNLRTLHPGTLDDASWLAPIGHIWTRSAQPWVVIDPESLQFERQPTPEQMLELVRAWKQRPSQG